MSAGVKESLRLIRVDSNMGSSEYFMASNLHSIKEGEDSSSKSLSDEEESK